MVGSPVGVRDGRASLSSVAQPISAVVFNRAPEATVETGICVTLGVGSGYVHVTSDSHGECAAQGWLTVVTVREGTAHKRQYTSVA